MRTVSFASRASIFFQHKTQLTQDGPDEFLNGKKTAKDPPFVYKGPTEPR